MLKGKEYSVTCDSCNVEVSFRGRLPKDWYVYTFRDWSCFYCQKVEIHLCYGCGSYRKRSSLVKWLKGFYSSTKTNGATK